MKKLLTVCILILIVLACKHEIIITGSVPTNLIYTPTGATIAFGTSGSSAAPTIDNGVNITYTLSNSGITGISINKTTGVISWSNIVAAGTYNLIINASNNIGSTTTTYTLIVNSAPTAPSALSYSPSSSTILKGTAGSSSVPTINNGGGGTITYSLTGTVPSGISISSSTGVISWSNAVSAGTYTLNVSAANSLGKTTANYTLTVNNTPTVTAPSSLSYNPASSSVTQGTAGTSATPTINNGLGTITYSLTGTIPSGISINSSMGVISWSNAVAIGTYTLNISASNSAGSTTTTYSLTVTAASTTVSFSKDLLPTLISSCGNCHSYTKTYSGVVAHTSGCNSIQNKIGTNYCSGSRMPQGSSALSASYITQFNNWIAQGQLNN